jgi:hypothetical protein
MTFSHHFDMLSIMNRLDLSENKIKSLSFLTLSSVSGYSPITTLTQHNDYITQASNSFSWPLSYLDLSSNSISQLGAGVNFEPFLSHVELNLDQNPISQVWWSGRIWHGPLSSQINSGILTKLSSSLRVFGLENRRPDPTSFSIALSSMKLLKYLVLDNIDLREVPAAVSDMPALSLLSLPRNPLRRLNLPVLPQLYVLSTMFSRFPEIPDNIADLAPRLRRLVISQHQLQSLQPQLTSLFWSNRLQAIELTPAVSGYGNAWQVATGESRLTSLIPKLRDTFGVQCNSISSRVFCGIQCPASSRPGVVNIGFDVFPNSSIFNQTLLQSMVSHQNIDSYIQEASASGFSLHPEQLFPKYLKLNESDTFASGLILKLLSPALFEQVLYRPRFSFSTSAASKFNLPSTRNQTSISRASMLFDSIPTTFETFTSAAGGILTHDGFPLNADIPEATAHSLLWIPTTARLGLILIWIHSLSPSFFTQTFLICFRC